MGLEFETKSVDEEMGAPAKAREIVIEVVEGAVS